MDILNAKGKPLRNSASATETYLDCKRKWAYGYYWRVERVISPAAEVGNKVHDVLEHWLKTGQKPEDPNNRYWRIAEPGVQYLPEVGENGVLGNWQIEEWVECQCGPIPFVGKVDLYNLEDFDNIQIDDHKTTGDSSWRWAKSPRQLAKLIQPHGYAWSIIQVHGLTPPESVDFRHIYYASKGTPKAMEVRAPNVPWSDIEETWRKLEIISTQMAELALSITEPEEVEATTTSCKKYGGCPYADRCAASPINRNKIKPTPIKVKRDPEMSDRLTALRAQLGLDTKKAPPTPRKAEAPKPVQDPQGDAQSLADKLTRAIEGGTDIPIAAAEAMARSADVHLYEAMELAGLKNQGGQLVKKVTEVLPPEPEAPAPPIIPFQHELGGPVDPVHQYWLQHLTDNDNRMSRKDAQAIIRDVTGAQRVRKERVLKYIEDFNDSPYRAPGAGQSIILQGNVLTLVDSTDIRTYCTPAEADALLEDALGPEPKPAKDLEEATLDKPASSKSDALLPTTDPKDTPLGRIVKEVATPTIYIDCIPEDPAGVYSFTDFIRPFEQEVEKEGGMVDKKFVQPLPYYGLIDFGKGPGKVAGKVLAALHRTGPQLFRGDMYVDGKHPLADEIIPILRRLKGVRVVRASR